MDTYLMQVVLWILCFMEVAMCFWLLDIFFNIRKSLTKKKLVAMIACVVIVGYLFASNRQMLFFSNSMWVFSMMITGIFAFIILRKQLLLVAELIVMFFSVVALLDFLIAFVVMTFLGERFWAEVYFWTISWWSVLIFGITRVLSIWLLLLVKRFAWKEMNVYFWRKVFFFIGVVLCVLVRFFQVLLVMIADGKLDFKSWTVGIVILSCLLILLFVVALFQKSYVLRTENEILLIRDNIQSERYLDLQHQSEENKHIVHDMKNHILTLQGLCQSNDIKAISSYLQEINGSFEGYVDEVWCDNLVINTILNQKLKAAKDRNITCDIQCVPYIKIPLSESEIVAVFGNLLDNAIEACQKLPDKERTITLEMEQKNNMFRLEITNSVCERPEIRNNKIVTSKKDKRNHGYGLKNVARVVEKYDGVMLLEATEHIFKISLSFFVTTMKEDI